MYDKYRRSLRSDRRRLLEHFELVQAARKVVGVGSVGQRAWVVLLEDDEREPMVLQAKQAQASVLADYCGHSRYRNQGERVVAAQHLMQAFSDIFLGWTHVEVRTAWTGTTMCVSCGIGSSRSQSNRCAPEGMTVYARLCAWTLARAHARSGDRVALAAYLGGSDAFDHAIAEFAEAYADQNARDYATFQEAAETGQMRRSRGSKQSRDNTSTCVVQCGLQQGPLT